MTPPPGTVTPANTPPLYLWSGGPPTRNHHEGQNTPTHWLKPCGGSTDIKNKKNNLKRNQNALKQHFCHAAKTGQNSVTKFHPRKIRRNYSRRDFIPE